MKCNSLLIKLAVVGCWLLFMNMYVYLSDGGLPLTLVYALKKMRDFQVGFGVVVQYKCTKCSFQSSKYELLQRK